MFSAISCTDRFNFGFSLCCSSTSSRLMMDRPALNMVRNCLVNRMSCGVATVDMASENLPKLPARFVSNWTLVGINPLVASACLASSRELASTTPLTVVPASLMAWYWKLGMGKGNLYGVIKSGPLKRPLPGWSGPVRAASSFSVERVPARTAACNIWAEEARRMIMSWTMSSMESIS